MRRNKKKEPWPTKAVMEQIYEKKLWGGNAFHDFYSGDGSHSSEIVEPYVKEVVQFLNSFSEKLVVCDLGCGDFNVGKRLVPHTKKYIGVDIVLDLITRNQKLFNFKNVAFKCLDISKNVLPKADVILLRQVMQHLSNAEIKGLLTNLKEYPYLIVTEHLPSAHFVANKDLISGQGIRLKKNSGVDIIQAPFYMQTTEVKQLCSYTYDEKSIIKTTLYQNV